MDIRLTRKEKRDLEAIVRFASGEARFHRRARMVLLADQRASVSAIAEKIGSSRSRVRDWLQRFGNQRLEGLEDLHRSGRPSEITSLERHQVVDQCEAHGRAAVHAHMVRTILADARFNGDVCMFFAIKIVIGGSESCLDLHDLVQ